MSNQTRAYEALGAKRIDISDDDELRFWMREFGVGAVELYEAVIAVGTSARLVGLYLRDLSFPHTGSGG